MRDERVCERCYGDEHADGEDDRLLPIEFPKSPIRCHAADDYEKENERCDAERYIGMESEAEKESAQKE